MRPQTDRYECDAGRPIRIGVRTARALTIFGKKEEKEEEAAAADLSTISDASSFAGEYHGDLYVPFKVRQIQVVPIFAVSRLTTPFYISRLPSFLTSRRSRPLVVRPLSTLVSVSGVRPSDAWRPIYGVRAPLCCSGCSPSLLPSSPHSSPPLFLHVRKLKLPI